MSPEKRDAVMAGILCLAIALFCPPAGAQTIPDSHSSTQAAKDYLPDDSPADSEGEKTPRKGIDMVFLLDISKSMDDVFDDVQRSLIDYVQKALPGDHIIIITFGEGASLAVDKSIGSASDKQEIIECIQGLSPTDYSTYIVAAVARGLQKLSRLKDDGSSRVRYLFLITDGKNNPPKSIANPLTFDQILKGYRDFRPGQEWFMHYVTLKQVDDSETKKFVQQIGGSISSVESSSLMESVNRTYVPILTQVVDVYNLVEVKPNGEDLWLQVSTDNLLREGDAVRTGQGARAFINFRGYGSTGVDEKTEFRLERIRLNPLLESADISIRLIRGNLTNIYEDVSGHSSRFEIVTPGASPYAGTLNPAED